MAVAADGAACGRAREVLRPTLRHDHDARPARAAEAHRLAVRLEPGPLRGLCRLELRTDGEHTERAARARVPSRVRVRISVRVRLALTASRGPNSNPISNPYPTPDPEQVTTKGFGARFRGKRSFDGLFSDNIPLFTDHVRPQLVFDLGKVQYALSALVQATDPCIEALAVRAANPNPNPNRHTG